MLKQLIKSGFSSVGLKLERRDLIDDFIIDPPVGV